RYEFFDDYDQFLYDMLSGRARGAAYVANGVVRAALDDAIASLRAAQGPNPAAWRAPMPQISFQSLDIGSIGTIPWENRGTWGQAIQLPAAHPGHLTRPRHGHRHRHRARRVR